ncbi:hypothetical protein EKN06_14005 [Croceicoccus ponticola]|uniref:Uncharacterized protein n=1 Tax=Croceicoccus ponticola TaxID=2217664 RepID=A0A437GWA7_9SPHN|nr:hypothetical protein EKN06_14005 [Croceicoccus ponticola]
MRGRIGRQGHAASSQASRLVTRPKRITKYHQAPREDLTLHGMINLVAKFADVDCEVIIRGEPMLDIFG